MAIELPPVFELTRTRQQHREDHYMLHRAYNTYAYVPAATGVAATDTGNIQEAIDSGKHVVLTNGLYYFNTLNFNNDDQSFTCSSNATLRGAATNSTIIVSGTEVSFWNVYINGASITGTVLQINASRFEAYRLQIDASNAAIGVKLLNAGIIRLVGGHITGNSGAQNGVGLEIGTGAYLLYIAGMTINHWDTGVLVSAINSVESSIFTGMTMDNNDSYAFKYDPSVTGILYNPSFINCHMEGSAINFYVGSHANIYGGTIQDCRFGQDTERCFKIDGAVRYTTVQGCFFTGENLPDAIVYELNGVNAYAIEQFVDLHNYWKETTLTTGDLASSLVQGILPIASDYGLHGNGSADNTDTLQALLDSLPAGRTTKAKVILTGTILLSDTITIPDYTSIEIKGIVTLIDDSDADIFRIGNGTVAGTHIEIFGGEIDGNRADQASGLCIRVQPGQDIHIHDLHVHDAKEQNIRVFGDSSRVHIHHVRGVDGEAGNIYFLHATVGGTQPEIVDSSIENCDLYYTVVSSSTTNIEVMNCRKIRLISNRLSGTIDFGIHAEEHFYDSLIEGNIIYGHTQDGIRMGYSEGVTIDGNNVFSNGYRGISLSQASNRNLITNNLVHENGRSGICLEDCRYNTVSANQTLNNNQSAHGTYNAGIQILSLGAYAPTYNTVRGNDSYDTQSPKTQQYGVSEGGSLANFNIVENNNVRDNNGAPFNNIGRGLWSVNKSIYRNNVGAYNYCPLPANDTTPTVAIDIGLFQTINSLSTTITTFDDGYVGQKMIVLIQDTHTVIDFTGTNLKGNGGSDWSPTTGNWFEAVFDGTNWYCAVH